MKIPSFFVFFLIHDGMRNDWKREFRESRVYFEGARTKRLI